MNVNIGTSFELYCILLTEKIICDRCLYKLFPIRYTMTMITYNDLQKKNVVSMSFKVFPRMAWNKDFFLSRQYDQLIENCFYDVLVHLLRKALKDLITIILFWSKRDSDKSSHAKNYWFEFIINLKCVKKVWITNYDL